MQSDGTFSVTPPSLPQGSISVSAEVLDSAGNLATANVSGLIDITIPILTLDAIELATTTPLISGFCDEIGATVTLTITDATGTQHNLSATVQSNGTFSVTPPNLPQGSISVSAEVLDSSGNLATANVSGLIDIIAPTLLLDDIVLNSAAPFISGSSDTSDALVTVTITDHTGGRQNLSVRTDINGDFVITPTALPQGEITVEVEIEDASGNSSVQTRVVVLDFTPPSLNIEITELNSDTPLIRGTSNEIGGIVELELLDAAGKSQFLSVEVDGSGTFSVVPDLVAEGQLSVSATLIDSAGNIATADVNGLIDITIPTLSLDAIGLINDATPTISGNTDEHNGLVEIVVTDAENVVQTLSVIADNVGDFVLDIPQEVAQGLLAIEASVTDTAGNSIDTLSNATIDTVAPMLEITSMPTLLTPVITGVTDPSEAGRSLDIDVTANILGIETTLNINTTVLADGSWSSGPIANLTVGPVAVTVAIIDEAGNFISVSETSTRAGDTNTADSSLVASDIVSVNLLSGAVTLDI